MCNNQKLKIKKKLKKLRRSWPQAHLRKGGRVMLAISLTFATSVVNRPVYNLPRVQPSGVQSSGVQSSRVQTSGV